MSTPLTSGDRCYFISPKGKKLRCFVIDRPNLRTLGEEEVVPVVRDIARRGSRARIDCPAEKIQESRVRWFKRSELRKLPSK